MSLWHPVKFQRCAAIFSLPSTTRPGGHTSGFRRVECGRENGREGGDGAAWRVQGGAVGRFFVDFGWEFVSVAGRTLLGRQKSGHI